MKTFSIHAIRNVFAFVIALGLGYTAYLVNPTTVAPTKADAGVASGRNVTGWAYSKGGGTALNDGSTGIGWISFNSVNADETSVQPYGVNISPMTGTGDFSGEAWAGNEPDSALNPTGIGWISFDRAVTGNPPAEPYMSTGGAIAKINWATGNVTGWARAIVACKDTNWDGVKCTSSSAGDKAGGWDGWIKLSDASWTDGVSLDLTTRKFKGYAYGGGGTGNVDIVGWIDFAPVNTTTGLPINDSPQVPAGACEPGNPSIIWSGTCNATASCVSGGPVIQTGLSGTELGSCNDGSTGDVFRSCVAPTTDCSGANSPTVYIVGDGICNAAAGENSTNSLADCKPKTRFWQF